MKGGKKHEKNKLLTTPVSDELQKLIKLHIEAMRMVSLEYGSSLSHKQFMDKAEEYFSMLLEESDSDNGVAIS